MIVEHQLDLVLSLADTAFVLERGAVSHVGPAKICWMIRITVKKNSGYNNFEESL